MTVDPQKVGKKTGERNDDGIDTDTDENVKRSIENCRPTLPISYAIPWHHDEDKYVRFCFYFSFRYTHKLHIIYAILHNMNYIM